MSVDVDLLRKKYEKTVPPPTEVQIHEKAETLHSLLTDISSLHTNFINSQSPEIAATLFQKMSAISNILEPLTEKSCQRLLNDIRTRDSSIWKKHVWDTGNWKDPKYHESNSQNSQVGIAPEQLMQHSRSLTLQESVKKLTLNLVSVYGPTLEDIRRASLALSSSLKK